MTHKCPVCNGELELEFDTLFFVCKKCEPELRYQAELIHRIEAVKNAG